MNRSTVLCAFLVVCCALSAEAGEFRVNGRSFTLPDGFTLELAAGPPLVDRPIVASFDENGRLYVADSSGSNDPVQKQLAEKPHRILRLEDTDGDGRFDRRTVFADKMMFPEGCLWHDGALYVAAPPSIWKLTDTDGDGIADQRSEWFQGKTLTGCANDLHGPYLGPDGWIYWCKGAFAQQTYERPGKPPFVTRASHVFRARPDGTGIEPVITGGMDNPVDLVFTPGGEMILSGTFLVHPGGGLRDGLLHAVYGGVYGKVHNVLDGHLRTGPDVLPVMTHLGPAAPCGLTRYESAVFGDGYQDNLFACCFNMHKLTRHVLIPDGATFKTKDEDFLVLNDPDFHPTDVQEDADGSLLVIDTGGWYKLCCPTSQFHRPEALGGIYRIRKTGAAKVDDPRGLTLDWRALKPGALVKLLGDPRPAVRQRAVETLPRFYREANKVTRDFMPRVFLSVQNETSVEARRNAVWAAARIDDEDIRVVASAGMTDRNETVRQAALHSVGLWRDGEAALAIPDDIFRGLSLQNRRAGAEAMGRVGDKKAVSKLLEEAHWSSDRILDHSIIYALIEIADPQTTALGLKFFDDLKSFEELDMPRSRRAALIALDQMDGGGLKAEQVAPLLGSKEPILKETAEWIVSRHPEWGKAVAEVLRARLVGGSHEGLTQLLARLASNKAVRLLLAERLRDPAAPRAERLLVLRAMAQSGLKDAPDVWIEGLTQAVSGDDPEITREAVAAVRALPLPKDKAGSLADALRQVASGPTHPAELRLEALASIPGGIAAPSSAIFEFLRAQSSPDHPVASRLAAADVLAKAKLSREQLLALIERLPAYGPLELNRMLGAFEQSTDDEVGLKLIAALDRSAALPSLRSEMLKPYLAKLGPKVRQAAEPLFAKLNVDAGKQKAKLEELLAKLVPGDVKRGQAVFHGAKAACASCHAIGYLGGKVGPDLTRIGQVRNERDLLEAIVFPSASFVRSYEPVVVATKEGQIFSGVLKKDAPNEIILATGPKDEARIARGDIEEVRPGAVSVMPAGLDQQLTPQELADLLAFLKACR